jgi:hypothetical protein
MQVLVFFYSSKDIDYTDLTVSFWSVNLCFWFVELPACLPEFYVFEISHWLTEETYCLCHDLPLRMKENE